MKKEITLRTISFKIMLLSFMIALVLVFLLYLIVRNITNTTNQTYFIITFGLIAGIICNAFIYKNSKLITFSFSENILTIHNIKSIPYSEIKNFNIYSFRVKNLGYIIRIKSDKNYYYWITWKSFYKKQSIDKEDNTNIINIFNNKLREKKKRESIDFFIQLIGWIPIIMLILGIVCLIGIFYYIFFII